MPTSFHSPQDKPSEVTAEQGEVHMDGPEGLAIAFTPDAAEETGNRLILTASEARAQGEDESPHIPA